MFQLSASFLNRPVLSLRTGAPIGATVAPIINPDNLKIEGFYCQDLYDKHRANTPVLLYKDIRDIIQQGFVVDDYEVLTDPEELIRLQPIMSLNFDITGKQVVTADKERVGKVSDYAIEISTLYIQKLYVSQSLFKSLSGGSLSIDRSQIIEVTNKHIVIKPLLNPGRVHTAPVTA
jgi:uncharacterized protein YrrD